MVKEPKRGKIFLFALGFLVVLVGLNAGVLSPIPRAAAQGQMKKDQPKVDVFRILIVNEDATKSGVEKAYTFAGVVVDRARTVKRNQTDAEVKVTSQMPEGKNPAQPFDVIFLIRRSYIDSGEILTFTSSPAEACRGFLKTFLTKTLSPKRISKAYKGGKLKPAKHLTQDLDGNGWLAPCTK
jgi:hypothetical protein